MAGSCNNLEKNKQISRKRLKKHAEKMVKIVFMR